MPGVFMSALIGYLLGSIPFGLLAGKLRGIDIRKHGSGNIGATNVFRTLGRNWGILVFALDAIKGLLAVLIAERVFGIDLAPPGVYHMPAGELGIVGAISCILGHNFPVWLGFKGGKGIATSAGVLIGLMPIAAGVAVLVWLAVFYTTRYVSAGSIGAAVVIPVAVWFTEGQADALFWFSLLISALAILRHKANIQRLMAGTENRFERKK